jgi:SEC-C motif
MNFAQSKNTKVGRNDPCHCGSNLKYKKCCLTNNEIVSQNQLEEIKRIQSGLKKNASQILGREKKLLFVSPDEKIIKMSEIIVEFSDEFLQKMHTKNQKKRVLELACLAWNLGVFADKNGQLPDLDEVMDIMEVRDNEKIEVFKYMLSVLANKKITEYSHIDRIIVNYKITDDGEDFRINVMSTVSQKEMFPIKDQPGSFEEIMMNDG